MLRLLDDTRVPFTNNAAEKALRMVKLHDKTSAPFHSLAAAEAFAAVRSYLQTAANYKQNLLGTLRQLFTTGAGSPPPLSLADRPAAAPANGPPPEPPPDAPPVAYDSVLPTWQWFLAHTQGKPVVLVGDSQGSAVLIHLISAEVDHEPSVQRRLLVALIVGGNLQVPSGKTVGATFTKVPLCTSGTETGCAIAFSSYPSQPPADSVFGRPGQGVSLQSGQTAKAGQQVACVNPAALSGGTADLDPYFLTLTQVAPDPYIDFALKKPVPTPWVTYPEALFGELQTRERGHLAPGHEPCREEPHPAPRERQRSGQSWRYRPGVGLPRLRVRPHPRQPAPRRRRRGGCVGVAPLWSAAEVR